MQERPAWTMNGFVAITVLLAFAGVNVYLLTLTKFTPMAVIFLIFLVIAGVILPSGFTVVQPNQAKVLTLFGRYVGTVRDSGFFLTVPLTDKKTVSLKVRNFNSAKLKVNDAEGSPIEIAAVIVFRVVDSAKAHFEVDQYETFVEIQSETALRHVASRYPYDNFTEGSYSLRGHTEEISLELKRDLQERLSVAGVEVMEARLTHLAYATEIASAMLQRQQASAIVFARQKIVEGAVSMVQAALEQIEAQGLVLDEERRAMMVNNLLVAIVSDHAAQPVINAGSLY
ncbi:MAG: SPFH domain-containing protein [Candidatus Carbobacillus altaicus]|nr:SPFH domain-containing protein [Candidatus Carbobacillus altaicus]